MKNIAVILLLSLFLSYTLSDAFINAKINKTKPEMKMSS